MAGFGVLHNLETPDDSFWGMVTAGSLSVLFVSFSFEGRLREMVTGDGYGKSLFSSFSLSFSF